MDDFDSFITHKNQKSDLKKAQAIGIEKYNLEQNEKIKILKALLDNYNDGRRKTFFCLAVNLLELNDFRTALNKIEENDLGGLSIKEKTTYVVKLFQEIADKKNIELKLRRKNKLQ